MSSQQNVFGSGLSVGLGYTFDPADFFKRPTTILRIVSWIFSIVVFGCISSGCYVDQNCIFNQDINACGYGIFVGSIAFVGCIGFLLVDAFLEQISSAQHRKYAVLADMIFSVIWTFFYFVGFCYLTNRLVNTPNEFITALGVQPWQINNARASVSFCFFSTCTFAALIFFSVQKYRLGVESAFPPSSQIESQVANDYNQQQPYQSGLPNAESGFDQPPFSSSDPSAADANRFKRPVY